LLLLLLLPLPLPLPLPLLLLLPLLFVLAPPSLALFYLRLSPQSVIPSKARDLLFCCSAVPVRFSPHSVVPPSPSTHQASVRIVPSYTVDLCIYLVI